MQGATGEASESGGTGSGEESRTESTDTDHAGTGTETGGDVEDDDGQTDSDSGTDTGTDTATDTDSETDTDTDTDSDSGTETDSATDTETGTAQRAASVSGVVLAEFDAATLSTLFPSGANDTTIRVVVTWGVLETAAGTYNWTPFNLNAALSVTGARVQPNIRLISPWAVTTRPMGCSTDGSTSPIDLDRAKPLEGSAIYSQTLYDFLKAFAVHFAGRFDDVVIDNEMNDPAFWCSSADDYMRVLSTAKKAFADAQSAIRIADGGIQGSHLLWRMLDDLLDAGEDSKAVALYQRAFGAAKTATEIRNYYNANIATDPAQLRTGELIALGVWQYPDVVNFHYYRLSPALADVVAFIRARAAAKPLMTNETGIVTPYAVDARAASVEMVKRFATLSFLDVRPIAWFGPTKNHIGGIFDFDPVPPASVAQPLAAFSQLRGMFRVPPVSHTFKYVAASKVSHYTFRYAQGYVAVLWTDTVGGSYPLNVATACEVTDFLGTVIPGTIVPASGATPASKNVSVSPEPVIVDCR